MSRSQYASCQWKLPSICRPVQGHIRIQGDRDEQVVHKVWLAEIELDGSTGLDFIKEQNCQLTLGQGHSELALNEIVTEL